PRARVALVTVRTREIYQSANGDRWLLARDPDTGRVFVRHEPNLPSGGQVADIEIGAFLIAAGSGPRETRTPAPDWNVGLRTLFATSARGNPAAKKPWPNVRTRPGLPRSSPGRTAPSSNFLAESRWGRLWVACPGPLIRPESGKIIRALVGVTATRPIRNHAPGVVPPQINGGTIP